MKTDSLLNFLKKEGVPIKEWGIREAKTIENLYSEVIRGEIKLEMEAGHARIIRSMRIVIVAVHYNDGKNSWHLKEDRQVFKDGRERRRELLVDGLGEKAFAGETELDAAYRALREELGISERLPLAQRDVNVVTEPKPSKSYPGLFTKYSFSVFDTSLPEHLYKPEGYIEHQSEKDNYFIWVKE